LGSGRPKIAGIGCRHIGCREDSTGYTEKKSQWPLPQAPVHLLLFLPRVRSLYTLHFYIDHPICFTKQDWDIGIAHFHPAVTNEDPTACKVNRHGSGHT
jgi:hypothetical protein